MLYDPSGSSGCFKCVTDLTAGIETAAVIRLYEFSDPYSPHSFLFQIQATGLKCYVMLMLNLWPLMLT